MKKILVKYPTRSRPVQFFETLGIAIEKANNPENIEFLISIDDDDVSMRDVIKDNITSQTISGQSVSKIHACNRDIDKAKTEWDILVLMSDDMICQSQCWDDIIRQRFETTLDKVVHYNDGYTADKLCTMCIMGKDYYNRFGYIYNPEYISLWADNEYTEVAKLLGRYEYDPMILFKHEHPMNAKKPYDTLMRKNESFYHIDKKTYERRKQQGFRIN